MDDQSGLTRREALKRGAGFLAGAVVAGGGLSGCGASYLDSAGASSNSKKTPVLLGIVDSYTGAFAASGRSQTQGAQLAVDELNKRGGILSGRQIEIKYRDDNTKADVGARGARELIQQENVDVIVGAVSSAVGLAISEACSQVGCPLGLTGTHDDTITGQSAPPTTVPSAPARIIVA